MCVSARFSNEFADILLWIAESLIEALLDLDPPVPVRRKLLWVDESLLPLNEFNWDSLRCFYFEIFLFLLFVCKIIFGEII